MEYDEAWMKNFIARRTVETWHTHERPYYLSFIATDMGKEGANYRSIIGPLRLRQWVTTTEIPGIKVVAHPVHKAKIGFIPEDKDFTFNDEAVSLPPMVPKLGDRQPKFSRNRYRLLQFLDLLSELNDEELRDINIPIKTIVRILKG